MYCTGKCIGSDVAQYSRSQYPLNDNLPSGVFFRCLLTGLPNILTERAVYRVSIKSEICWAGIPDSFKNITFC